MNIIHTRINTKTSSCPINEPKGGTNVVSGAAMHKSEKENGQQMGEWQMEEYETNKENDWKLEFIWKIWWRQTHDVHQAESANQPTRKKINKLCPQIYEYFYVNEWTNELMMVFH